MSKLPAPIRLVLYLLIAALLVTVFAISIQVTQPDMVKLVTSAPKARQILSQLLAPDLTDRIAEVATTRLTFPVPCGSASEEPATTTGARIVAEPGCADPRAKIMLRGFELGANTDVVVRWVLPSGDLFNVQRIVTDANGNFETEIDVRPIAAAKDGVPAKLEAEYALPGAVLQPSQTLKDVINAMFVTIFMALLATSAGTIIAAPLSFLAASNITRRGPVGTAIYYITRFFFNVIRSYEPLVMATIFALIVGFGSPFAGVLALVIVTTASLGKMFSEAVESIQSGPIEAITATGANRLEVIVYSVVPQIIPDFLSFTIYHWDINVRISTIIGFVGGGGIGYYLSQRINTFEYNKAGTAILAIVIVVWVLDFLSAEIRKKLT